MSPGKYFMHCKWICLPYENIIVYMRMPFHNCGSSWSVHVHKYLVHLCSLAKEPTTCLRQHPACIRSTILFLEHVFIFFFDGNCHWWAWKALLSHSTNVCVCVIVLRISLPYSLSFTANKYWLWQTMRRTWSFAGTPPPSSSYVDLVVSFSSASSPASCH